MVPETEAEEETTRDHKGREGEEVPKLLESSRPSRTPQEVILTGLLPGRNPFLGGRDVVGRGEDWGLVLTPKPPTSISFIPTLEEGNGEDLVDSRR